MPICVAATRFFTGTPFAARDRRTLSVGGRTIVDVARRVWGFDDAALGRRLSRDGRSRRCARAARCVRRATRCSFGDRADAGDARRALRRDRRRPRANARGARREAVLERILRACGDPLAATYVVKIVTGDLRVGLREGLVLDAIAEAFDAAPGGGSAGADGGRRRRRGRACRQARNARRPARRVRHADRLHARDADPVRRRVRRTRRATCGSSKTNTTAFALKRTCARGRRELFSRRLNDVTAAYPEVVDALAALERDAILDGEIVAMRDGRVLPFRTLQARLQRKSRRRIAACRGADRYVVFDLLALRRRAADRRAADRRAGSGSQRSSSPAHAFAIDRERTPSCASRMPATINARFDAARARGNEGLDAQARRRAVSRPGGAESGGSSSSASSRRSTSSSSPSNGDTANAPTCSPTTRSPCAATRASCGRSAKPTPDLTDAEIAELTQWFLEHRSLRSSSARRRGRRRSRSNRRSCSKWRSTSFSAERSARKRLRAALSAHRPHSRRQAGRGDRHAASACAKSMQRCWRARARMRRFAAGASERKAYST